MKKVLRLRTFFLASFCLGIGIFLFLFTASTPKNPLFVIISGDTATRVADRLQEQGFIRSARLFSFVMRTSGLSNRLQPGTYDLSDIDSVYGIARRLAGKSGNTETILRIIEGWNIRDIDQYLRSQNISGDITKTSSLDWPKEFSFLQDKPASIGLEGYLFPDTYRVYNTATAEDVTRVMLKNFEKKITPELRQKISASGKSLFATITMASIVESEVQTSNDRQLVADIFWRRLANKMPLQADSTVNYATGKKSPAVSSADLAIDSPYNTYKYRGLPVGPICNPGLDAITATMTPLKNEYWYFLTDAKGKVYYAKTLDEQLRNKRKYAQ